MHALLTQQQPDFEEAIEFLQKELSQMRTGRATPVLVESIQINAYGSLMELKGVASITTQDAKTLAIEPWDKSLLKAIETAIQKADIGIQPVVSGDMIRLSMPQITEESRKQLVKRMKEYLEETRVRMRAVREKARESITKMEKEKEITEDDKFKLFEDLDKLTREYTERVDQLGAEKEKEVMTI